MINDIFTADLDFQQLSTSNITTIQSAKSIADIGEKIGGARKDTASVRPRSARKQKNMSTEAVDHYGGKPAWFRRFRAFENMAQHEPLRIDRWSIADELRRDKHSMVHLATRQTYASEQEALLAIPLLALAQKHRALSCKENGVTHFKVYRLISDRKRVQVVRETFATETDAMKYMATHAETILNTKTTFGEADLPIPAAYQRIGNPWHRKDVQGEDFMARFNLRAVEFGNWNNQEDRQFVLNVSYEALLDMANVLNLPATQIGLFGDLALAFGARGQGLSSARAHFERSKVVINLTKMKGAGSLAHEWGHALDNLLAKKEGKAPKMWQLGEDGTKSIDATSRSHGYLSHGVLSGKSLTSPELLAAFSKLIQRLFKKPAYFQHDKLQATKHVQTARDRLAERLGSLRTYLAVKRPYGTRHVEPASDGQLSEFDVLAETMLNRQDSGLEYRQIPGAIKPKYGMAPARLTNDELDGLNTLIKKVRGHFGLKSDHSGLLDDLRQPLLHLCMRRQTVESAQRGDLNEKTVPTEFAMAATELDQGRGENYWRQEHEMFARAFSAYIEDKLAETGRISNYLNYAPEDALIVTSWGAFAPFPQASERKKFNALFDDLFNVIRSEWADEPVSTI